MLEFCRTSGGSWRQNPRRCLIASTFLIAACGADDHLVVAEVGSFPITASAIRTYVEQLPPDLRIIAADSTARRQYLQALIDRSLLLSEARALGLDTTGAVRHAQTAAGDSLERENLLLEALKKTLGDPSLSEAETRRFYRNRPELFYDEAARDIQPYEKAKPQAYRMLLRQRREAELQEFLARLRGKYQSQIRVYPEHLERALNDSLLQTSDRGRGIKLSQRGSALLKAGRPRPALNALKQAATYDPSLDKAHFNRGLAHARLGQHDQAVAAFERAIGLNPDVADYHYGLGSVLQARHRYSEAAACLQKAISLAPDQPDYHFRLGEAFRSMIALEEAEKAYANALRLQPDHSEARYRYSDLLGRRGDLPGARAGFERILAREPHNVSALIGLAWVHTKAEQHHEAVQSLQQATRLHPHNANARYLLSQAYSHAGQEARADSQMAIFQRLSAAERRYTQGVKAAKQGQWDRSRGLFAQAIESDSTYLRAYIRLGLVHLYQKDPRKAIAVLTRAHELDPGDVEVLCLLGEANLLKEKPARADRFFAAALDLDSTSVRAHHGRGRASYLNGDMPDAAAAFESALAVDPDHRDSYYQLALTYLKLGHPRKAVYNLRQCLDIDPDDVPASYALGISYLGNGDPRRARRAFEKVLEMDPDHSKAREKLAQLEQKAE